ncbi:GNAT family N-acetyltransferase [Vibrio sp. B1Z05]|uniref:GNAT family N-acetyltransferase n=1 Tax=Vibrio sp. B1Z05 TaxID=2654980 RepID=UPI00128D7AB4|nr:GNAT family N-acetyltransferase [Vibrio sp. B1Z05]MPW36086.1 GNAT family N-acetyltransferase [Vibrio sp. B1Z05]
MPYRSHAQQLLILQSQAFQSQHRIGVILKGSEQWQQQVLQHLGELHRYQRALVLGERTLSYAETVTFKQARQKLGQESDLIVADLNCAFDANGFTAVTGTLKGGSLLLILPNTDSVQFSELWMARACQSFISICESSPSVIETGSDFTQVQTIPAVDRFSQQRQAIEAIHKVLSGHRKRPLVITADRGRGKSAALGIAAAQIIKNSNKHVVITAPSTQAVKTLFEHASKELGIAPQKGYHLCLETGASLRFIAPDELLRDSVNCDLLLVDEAAAIPLPLLQSIVERYHRTCFATTVHGYEGCGRGFSIKFSAWLNQHRPGWKSLKLTQPIRWSLGDPVEAWLFDTFLLDAEIESLSSNDYSDAKLLELDITDSTHCVTSLRKAFALLVNAHYQTSPNDVFQLLDDPNIRLYQVISQQQVVGVILGYREGGLNESQLQDIQLGKRRPAGHLVPISLVSNLADNRPALVASLRVMRIAVHPETQGIGLGSWMLSQLASLQEPEVAYLSTSFGVNSELFNFWCNNGFEAVRLGSKQDQASGCFSVSMVKALNSLVGWKEDAQRQLQIHLIDTASDIHLNLPTTLLLRLLISETQNTLTLNERTYKLISNYTLGGASFEATRILVQQLLVSHLSSVLQRSAEYDAKDYADLSLIADLSIKKQSWAKVCQEHGFTGRKQAEAQYRQAISYYLLTTQPV